MVVNLTFAIESNRVKEFIRWMEISVPSFFSNEPPTLLRVVEAGGEELSENTPASFALQLYISHETKREDWEREKLLPFLQKYRQDFASDAVFFMTVMEKIF